MGFGTGVQSVASINATPQHHPSPPKLRPVSIKHCDEGPDVDYPNIPLAYMKHVYVGIRFDMTPHNQG
jgi:hypothetical protein